MSTFSGALGWRSLSLLAACLLLMSAPSVSAFRNQSSSSPLPYNVIVQSGYYQYFPIDTVSSNSIVMITVSSNTSVSTALMTASQVSSFNNDASDLSDSLFLQNGTTVQHSFHEPVGDFDLLFYSNNNGANISYNYQTFPTDPYYSSPLPPPEPTGIASYGLYNASGNAVSYQVDSDQVVGIADISAMQAYNATAASDQSNLSGATLQLNSVLVVNEAGGQQQAYWAQNTPDFVTAASQVAYGDNVWNFSVSGFLSNSTVTSADGGSVASAGPGVAGDYYSQEINNSTYSFPLVLALLMNETAMPGQGVLIQMGAQILENGTGPTTSVNWFDSITINDPTVQSAYFLVSGNQTAPNGLYYDTELVLGGENNGEATDFTQMSASLGLFYDNASSGVLDSFPSLYSFGGDTAEAADNLQVSYSGNGFAQVSTGTPDYVYLGQTSGTLSFPLSLSELNPTSSSSSSSGSSSTQTSSSSGQSTSSTTSTSSSSGGGVPEFPYQFAVAALFTVLLAASYLLVRRNRAVQIPRRGS
ncbi:MAG: thermopsin [Thaumarchaeota archaeon]|nr:thermopsin [Nitrososphaerota archaeon]